ncbi:flagellum-specific ATP synthase [Sphingobium sp. B2D3A]|uniref:FliI/YscN family ATPase n=1 Tax=Sphingobium TaxID=165695 RepID=UPI0015EC92E7|nr:MULTISPECIES: FliI/YscN family ATPase [Sphingobium]MCW2336212.1 flagellum-specific ATP synthase [Sphingobium sp. B2D3A]MCW2348666.1 flagellum-specific ATP synthase [Sphingobium sp. B12D2B]MCW2363679.1 flagellum-specific ATP synthase [Sphingobium sp. B10D3B]MCW2383502.1 flagellum-specific ATP synthase [Sphingobium sp. B2D3B]MCW2385967.1 flagellum-specific ATP synthase [Sphingobium sp. B2D3D]
MIQAELARATRLLDHMQVPNQAPRHVGRLVGHDGGMLEVTGFSRPIGAGARIRAADGTSVRAEVVGFRGSRAVLVPLDQDAPLENGARVEPDSAANMVQVGEGLIGRVIDAMGQPLDRKGPVLANGQWPLAGVRGNVLDRGRVLERFDLGVRAVNALLTAGRGQRIAIMAGSGVGKSVLMGQMIAGAEADVIVTGLIGERGREVSDFLETKIGGALMNKSVVVAVPADHPPVLRLRAAARATAIAEYFRARGKQVLLLIDSLTRCAHAQREIGLSLGEPPAMKGYPPSALSLIPRLVERAGVDSRSGGSITAIYTVLADGDDTDDPIVDTARAIVDGHIVLSRHLSEQSIFPAIDVGRSLSRVMADIVDDEHLRAAANYRRLWAAYEENRDLILMGAYRPGNDPTIDEAVERRQQLLGFLRQSSKSTIDVDTSAAALIAEFGA